MLLKNQSLEKIPNNFDTLENLYKLVEKITRVCYKSEQRISEDSYKDFVQGLINRTHTSPLEHATIYLVFKNTNAWNKYINNKYSKYFLNKDGVAFVTTNFRVLLENSWLNDFAYISLPTPNHYLRVTFKVQCARAIATEFLRHRVLSFTQESTRFTKYVDDLVFIKPFWCKAPEGKYTCNDVYKMFDHTNDELKDEMFLYSLCCIEENFKILLSKKIRPQEVRDILPLCFKADLYITGFIEDFLGDTITNKGVIPLRTHSSAHPDIRELATLIDKEIKKDTNFIESKLYDRYK